MKTKVFENYAMGENTKKKFESFYNSGALSPHGEIYELSTNFKKIPLIEIYEK